MPQTEKQIDLMRNNLRKRIIIRESLHSSEYVLEFGFMSPCHTPDFVKSVAKIILLRPHRENLIRPSPADNDHAERSAEQIMDVLRVSWINSVLDSISCVLRFNHFVFRFAHHIGLRAIYRTVREVALGGN